jgi:hypothetical protein
LIVYSNFLGNLYDIVNAMKNYKMLNDDLGLKKLF